MRDQSGPPKNDKDLSDQDVVQLAEDMRRQVRDLREKARAYRKVLTAASTDTPAEGADKRRD